MKLQLALDFVTLDEALGILREVGDLIDIAEVGTPFVVDEGMRAVRAIRAQFPALRILADLKIMDAGDHEARSALAAGADIVTVLGVSNDATIKAAADAAHEAGKEVMVDMIDAPDLARRAAEIDGIGVDYICVHTAFDIQHTGKNPLDELQQINRVLHNAKAAVAGGITLDTIASIAAEKPAILVVGGGITGQADRRAAAQRMREIIGNTD